MILEREKTYINLIAGLEATKSVASKIRLKTGLDGDGASLVNSAFGLGSQNRPVLAFNSLQSETERREHKGISALIKGMFATFRNVTAHEPRIHWEMKEEDALDLLSMASFLHRRLDSSKRMD